MRHFENNNSYNKLTNLARVHVVVVSPYFSLHGVGVVESLPLQIPAQPVGDGDAVTQRVYSRLVNSVQGTFIFYVISWSIFVADCT